MKQMPVPHAAENYQETRFSVPGMRCAGCISKIENDLNHRPGVAAARVNFSTRQVAISHSGDIDPPQLHAWLAEIGFEAEQVENPVASPDAAETRALVKALAVAGFAAMNIMLLSVAVWSGAEFATRQMFHWISALIAIPAIAYSGRPFFRSALAALRHGRTNMDVPISIGVLLATGMSLYETMVDGPHAYFDGAVMLLAFLLAGRVLDAMMRDRARGGVAALLKHAARGAMVLDERGVSRWVASADLQAGMVMLVAAGDRLAADGVIEEGETHADLSHLTGEVRPERMGPGDAILAGSLNLDTPIRVRVTAAGADTSLADIARLMDAAGQSRSRYVRIADRAARLYAPAVHSLALLAFAGWMLAGAGWHQALLIAVAVLIITCPCALGLAVPVAQVVTAGALMRLGLLVKDGSALERLAEVDGVVFDKTGTLTMGSPVPVSLDMMNAREKAVALTLARASKHPVSQGLAIALVAEGVEPVALEDLREEMGEGVYGRLGGTDVFLGRIDDLACAESHGCMLKIGHRRGIVIAFAETLRPEAKETVDEMRAMALRTSILSGDRASAVAPIARLLGMTAQCNARPKEKLAAIRRLSQDNQKLLMIGDGLNDGPALAAAHASMAPGSASDVGQQAADIVFTSRSLMPVVQAIGASRRTMKIVRQNFALAIGYNVLAVPLALAGMVTPLVAAIAMSGSSLIVVANALRLNRIGS
ncbi:MAG: heavy metal translocating P-type ATPase [Blastomonas sp.]